MVEEDNAAARSPADARAMRYRLGALAVHGLTASGVFFALLAVIELMRDAPDPRRVFLWLAVTVLIDAADGPLARYFDTKTNAPQIDGRTIDDILDYITFTFIPLLLIWRMGWIAGGSTGLLLVGLAMFTSLFGFAHQHAKDERLGFFRGFPSYWNLAAFYLGLCAAYFAGTGVIVNTIVVFALAVLTVMPVRFIYPNLAPRPWRTPLLAGALAWTLLLLAMLPWYPRPAAPEGNIPAWLVLVSLTYPAIYVLASLMLHRRAL